LGDPQITLVCEGMQRRVDDRRLILLDDAGIVHENADQNHSIGPIIEEEGM
jgi:hypothetical protein